MLIGTVAVAAPATVVPSSLQSLLGEAKDSPPTSPTTTRPPWRTAAPIAAALPTAAAVPADPAPAILNPPLPEVLPPTTTPEAVPVRALVAHTDPGDISDDESDAAGRDDSATRFSTNVIKLTNKERRDAGCADVAPDSRLTQSAQHHATDMAQNDYFAHESEDGTRFDTRIRQEGHPRPGGENIAKGQTSAEQVVREWMASPPHRRNIENCAFTTIGVGYDDNYWVQDFGR
ncbi:CAP domain-containing protein [Pseudonocardia aurantiaca]|uniref:CAP domain-containing protein n=1 Tax=Pseudonocardia aurantiaca TaxID=75290 RepID=A0ABW4FU41_9PSEU